MSTTSSAYGVANCLVTVGHVTFVMFRIFEYLLERDVNNNDACAVDTVTVMLRFSEGGDSSSADYC